jgi:glucose-1-phosphate adenylyltransferase
MEILAFVLAGGEGTRLRPLTARHPKPALPFAGRRIIDFALSNLVNSGIGAIYVLAQYKPRPIVEHIERAWSPMLRGTGRFAAVVLPDGGPDGAFLGTADAVYKNLGLVERHRPELVAVFAADHVYRMDVGQMAAFHVASGATVSVSALPVPLSIARSFGAITTASDGRIESFEEKPRHPPPMPTRPGHAYASMGNYLFDPDTLVDLLTQAHLRGESDFGRHILPRAARTHRLFAYDFSGNRLPGLLDCEEACYWRDVGTLEAYRAAQEDALGPRPRFNVENALWPIRGGGTYPAPASRPAPLRGERPVLANPRWRTVDPLGEEVAAPT